MENKPINFIGESIQVVFDHDPLLEKKQGCPNGFIWRDETFTIIEMLAEWHDYRRKGRSARNMQPQHAIVASSKGSWGVGKDYYEVKTSSGRCFTIYFDRAPKDAFIKHSGWFLRDELDPC